MPDEPVSAPPSAPGASPLPAPGARAGRLLADVGGTHLRLAWQAAPGAPLEDLATLSTADWPTPETALAAWLARWPDRRPRAAALAVAAPVQGDTVAFTNQAWSFSVAALRAALGVAQLRVLNDFTALALGLPDLPDAARRPVGLGVPAAGQALALIGPGTGLGVSGLLPVAGGGWVPVQGEGGHVTLPATTPREAAVLAWLHARHGHVSAERVLSGPGLAGLYAALAALDGAPVAADAVAAPDAAAVSERALQAGEPRAREALDLFAGWLGTVAGNLALTLGARGGVYLGGGILPRWGAWFREASPFRARFDARGRYTPYLSAIPVWVIDTPVSPALAGAARALDAGDWGVVAAG